MPIDLFRGLNDRQREAILINDKPLLILAGAGSGKTRVLTHKIAYLILKERYPASSILAMTFTNKAAQEMKNRISKMLGGSVESLWIGTFHSLFARILRRHADLIGYTSNFTIFDRDDSLQSVKEVLKRVPSGAEINPRNTLGQISHVKNAFLPIDEAVKLPQYEQNFKQIYEYYNDHLNKSNALDFDDLLLKPLELFEKFPEVLQKYQDLFKFILIDEYQDTNLVQFKLAKYLADKHKRICVVGDEDQSIYGWRGANIGNILTFADSFPKAEIVRLEQNFRSFGAILEVANSVVKQNKNRLGKALFTEKGEGTKPVIFECETGQKEAQKTFDIISGLIKDKKCNLGDIAVLYRTNAHSRLLEEILRNQGISYDIVGGTKFYDRMEIKDIIAYLRLIVNPNDFQAFQRMISTPKRGVGAKTLQQIFKYAIENNKPILDAFFELVHSEMFPEKTLLKLKHLVEIFTFAKEQNGEQKAAVWVEEVLNRTGLVDHYQQLDAKEKVNSFTQSDAVNLRVDNLFDFVDTVNEFTERRGEELIGIDEFIQEIQLQTDIDNWNESPQKVTLMTIHQAKGLEFHIIIISGLEQGLLPLSRNFELPDDLEEERRLFYVAVTRAEDELYMTYARKRFRHGDEMYCLPSQFIDEIDPGLVEIKRSVGDIQPYSRRTTVVGRTSSDDEPYYDFSDNQLDDAGLFKIGLEVKHPAFGDGKIINIEGFGGNTKITVLFYDGYFSKKLLKRYAKLQIIES